MTSVLKGLAVARTKHGPFLLGPAVIQTTAGLLRLVAPPLDAHDLEVRQITIPTQTLRLNSKLAYRRVPASA